MNNQKIKMMVQGAMLAALFGVLGVINIYTGTFFDILLTYVMTVMMVYYVDRYGMQAGALVDFVSAVVLFCVGNLFFMFYSCTTMILGIVYGGLRQRYSITIIKWILRGISLIKYVLIFYVLGSLLGLNATQEIIEMHQELINVIPMFEVISPMVIIIGVSLMMCFSEAVIVEFYGELFLKRMKK